MPTHAQRAHMRTRIVNNGHVPSLDRNCCVADVCGVRGPQPLPPMREYPEGRWFNHTVFMKDQWVMQQTKAVIDYRIKVETNQTLIRKG